MLRAIRENFATLRALGIPVTPSKLRVVGAAPERMAMRLLTPVLASRWMDIVAARHANAASDEMAQLAGEFDRLRRKANVPGPANERLAAFIDPRVPPLPLGADALG